MFCSFFIIYLYIYIYISIYRYCIYISINIYICIFIYIYILKKERNILLSFAKERNVLTFFYVLCKRTLRSFTFFAKERCVLKNAKERNVLLGLISRQKLQKKRKRTERSFFRTKKNVTYRTEKNGVPNPDYKQPFS